MIGNRSELVLALHGFSVQRLDILEDVAEGDLRRAHLFGRQTIKHERVVRVRAMGADDFTGSNQCHKEVGTNHSVYNSEGARDGKGAPDSDQSPVIAPAQSRHDRRLTASPAAVFEPRCFLRRRRISCPYGRWPTVLPSSSPAGFSRALADGPPSPE